MFCYALSIRHGYLYRDVVPTSVGSFVCIAFRIFLWENILSRFGSFDLLNIKTSFVMVFVTFILPLNTPLFIDLNSDSGIMQSFSLYPLFIRLHVQSIDIPYFSRTYTAKLATVINSLLSRKYFGFLSSAISSRSLLILALLSFVSPYLDFAYCLTYQSPISSRCFFWNSACSCLEHS